MKRFGIDVNQLTSLFKDIDIYKKLIIYGIDGIKEEIISIIAVVFSITTFFAVVLSLNKEDGFFLFFVYYLSINIILSILLIKDFQKAKVKEKDILKNFDKLLNKGSKEDVLDFLLFLKEDFNNNKIYVKGKILLTNKQLNKILKEKNKLFFSNKRENKIRKNYLKRHI